VAADVADQSTDSPGSSSPTQVFVSYRRDDARQQVPGIVALLGESFGEKHVFWDVDSMRDRTGPYKEYIEGMLATCHAVLIVIGHGWLEAADHRGCRRLDDPEDFHRQEITIALERRDVEVIPVLLDGAPMPDPPRDDEQPQEDGQPHRRVIRWWGRKPPSPPAPSPAMLPKELARLAGLQAHEVSFDRRYHADVNKLIEKITQAREKQEAAREIARKAAIEEQERVAERRLIESAEAFAQGGNFTRARELAGYIENPVSRVKLLQSIVGIARENDAAGEVEAARQALHDAADAIVDRRTATARLADDDWQADPAAKLKGGEE
jgi:TIR domain